MPRRKPKPCRISVFRGRGARLNCAIFRIFTSKSPLTIYGVCKEIRKQKALRHTKYTVVNRRVRSLEEARYLEKVGTRTTKAGFTVHLYQLSLRGHLALVLKKVDLDDFLQNADEALILMALCVFTADLTS